MIVTRANIALLLIMTTVASIAAASETPAWLLAKPGVLAFLSSGGKYSPWAGGKLPWTPVCPTISAAREFLNASKESDSFCVLRKRGTLVVIDSIPENSGLAKIHAVDGSFQGYIALTALSPQIPHGVTVRLRPAAGQQLTLSPSQSANVGQGLFLDASIGATTIDYDPAISSGRDLRVRIEVGKFAGKVGWIYSRQAYVAGDFPINVFLGGSRECGAGPCRQY
jgi:hypothetical protein